MNVSSLKLYVKMSLYSYFQLKGTLRRLKFGQKSSYKILQNAHRLEKGLINANPRPFWGWEKAEELVILLSEELSKEGDLFAIKTGCAVLKRYIEKKQNSTEEQQKVQHFLNKMREVYVLVDDVDKNLGGFKRVCKEDVIVKDLLSVESFFDSRHSVRSFSDDTVEFEKILHAINMANKCPSACNRQPTHVYIIDGDTRSTLGEGNDMGADKYLILTSDILAYNLDEVQDWIVSTSIFAGYLSLALHAEGRGNCVIRKCLFGPSRYNEELRRYCKIPDNEQIIIEIAIGHYAEEFNVCISNRKDALEFTNYVDVHKSECKRKYE